MSTPVSSRSSSDDQITQEVPINLAEALEQMSAIIERIRAIQEQINQNNMEIGELRGVPTFPRTRSNDSVVPDVERPRKLPRHDAPSVPDVLYPPSDDEVSDFSLTDSETESEL